MNFFYRSVQFGLMHIWPVLVLFCAAITLPIKDIGTVALLMSAATLFRPIIGLSLGRVAIKFISGTSAPTEKAVLALATKLGILVSIFTAVAIAIALAFMEKIYNIDSSLRLKIIIGVFIYLFAITELLDGIYRARMNFRQLALAVAASRIFGIFLLFFLFPLLPTLDWLFAFLIAAEAICVLALLYYHISYLKKPPKIQASIRSRQSLELLKYSVPVVINSVAVYFYARAMVLIAGLYETSENIGSLEIAIQITNLPMAITIIFATVLSPTVARLFSRGPEGITAAGVLMSQAAAFALWANMILASWLFLVGPFFLKWLLPNLPMTAHLLSILAPLVAVRVFAQILSGEIAIATGVAATVARITLLSAVATVGLGIFMTRQWGVTGAAGAIVISHSCTIFVTFFLLRSRTGLNLYYCTHQSISSIAPAAILTAICVFVLKENPAQAALFGTVLFVFAILLTVRIAYTYDLSMIQPIRDGIIILKAKN